MHCPHIGRVVSTLRVKLIARWAQVWFRLCRVVGIAMVALGEDVDRLDVRANQCIGEARGIEILARIWDAGDGWKSRST